MPCDQFSGMGRRCSQSRQTLSTCGKLGAARRRCRDLGHTVCGPNCTFAEVASSSVLQRVCKIGEALLAGNTGLRNCRAARLLTAKAAFDGRTPVATRNKRNKTHDADPSTANDDALQSVSFPRRGTGVLTTFLRSEGSAHSRVLVIRDRRSLLPVVRGWKSPAEDHPRTFRRERELELWGEGFTRHCLRGSARETSFKKLLTCGPTIHAKEERPPKPHHCVCQPVPPAQWRRSPQVPPCICVTD